MKRKVVNRWIVPLRKILVEGIRTRIQQKHLIEHVALIVVRNI